MYHIHFCADGSKDSVSFTEGYNYEENWTSNVDINRRLFDIIDEDGRDVWFDMSTADEGMVSWLHKEDLV